MLLGLGVNKMGCADFEKTPMRPGDFVNERSIFEIGRFEDMAAEAAMPVKALILQISFPSLFICRLRF